MLNLHRLTLKGFGCFEEEKIFDYEEGFNLFHCDNGKGKTTSLNAIEMLLLSNYEGSYSDYINNNSNEFTISLEFELDGYSLKETLNCKKAKSVTSTRTLVDLKTNTELANGEKVKDWLNEHLPTSTTKYALFARQNSDTDIINCGDSERRDIFKKIQDLDFSKEIKDFVDSKIETIKNSMIETDKEIFALENKTYEEKELLELPFEESEYECKKNELEKYISEKALSEEKVNRRNLLLKQISSLSEKIESDKISLDNKKHLIEEKNNIVVNSDTEKENLDKLCNNEIEEKKNETSNLNSQLLLLDDEKEEKKNEIQNNIDLLKNELISLNDKINSIKLVKVIKFNDVELNDAISKVSEKQTEIKINEKNIESLKEGVCPICGSDCSHKLNEFETINGELKNELIKLESEVSHLKVKKLEIENKTNRNLELKNTKLTLENTKNKIENNISTYEREIETLDVAYEQKKQNLLEKINNAEKSIESIKEKYETKKNHIDEKVEMYKIEIKECCVDIATLTSVIKSNTSTLNDLIFEKDSINIDEIDENVIDELKIKLNSYDEVVAKNKVIDDYNKNIEELKVNDLKTLSTFKEKRVVFEKQQYDLESSKSIMMKDFPNWVIENSIQTMENNMNEFINDVYYKPLNISLRSTKTAIKLEYGNEENKLPCSRLSGAEKQLTNLSFINNFNKMLNLGVIILDEFDSACDDKRKEMLYESLINLKDVYKQIIVVTHSSKMANYICANTETNKIEL